MQANDSVVFDLADGRRFLRQGSCDGCNRPGLTPGACCTFIAIETVRPYSEDEQNWVQLHPGLSFINPSLIKVDVRCSALTEDGRCSLFGLPERPVMCQQAPLVPDQLQPGCSYTLMEVSR